MLWEMARKCDKSLSAMIRKLIRDGHETMKRGERVLDGIDNALKILKDEENSDERDLPSNSGGSDTNSGG